ncbi:GNAT family N-acetyltransferase [Dactylosporangium darangshiense]|uniref:GNAT family N-acetyltransferase n=1 Tax=Dactylosporangium darangshiense TaxID=579108 RepID=A0ABP8DNT6_9ACTN
MQRTLRPISGRDELDLFRRLPYVLNSELDGDLTAGRRRAEWLWVALDGDRVVARAGWWARAGSAEPFLMDFFDFADGEVEAGEELLRAALDALVHDGATPPEYIRFIPPDWHDDPGAVQSRMAVLERLGARPLVERRRLEWRPGAGVPAASGRLRFREFSGTTEALDLMTQAVQGTLDAHHRTDLERLPPRAVAEEHLHGELVKYPSPHDWWRVATLPNGEPVGFVFPARNDYGPIIAYIGVLPQHRGHGYIDDVLAEGTRVLAGQDAPRIRATTDVGNVPMARAFARAGYDNYQNELNMTW